MSRAHAFAKSLTLGLFALGLLLAPTLADARGSSFNRGRATAIRAELAKEINSRNLMHVKQVKPSQIRFTTKTVKAAPGKPMLVGSTQRTVTWKLKSGILRGTAVAHTPVVPNGGKHTKLSQFRITLMPKAAPPAAR